MKIITTGATGRVGAAVLKHLLAQDSVSSVVALSRREIDMKDPKLTTVIVKDFLNYDQAVLDQLAGAEACIWCIGTPTAGREVHYDLTMAAATAFEASLAPKLPAGQRFRFVYTSGAFVERDQSKFLWFLSATRKMRGEVETAMLEFEQAHAASWQSYVLRPGAVTDFTPPLGLDKLEKQIAPSNLAAAAVAVATKGDEKRVLENADLNRIARENGAGK